MIKLCIFDLDGTLLFTVPDIAQSINFALSQHGLPPMSLPEVQSGIGEGLSGLLKKAMKPDDYDAMAEDVKKAYIAHHTVHCTDQSFVYAGVMETLQALSRQGIKLAVNTNKPQIFLHKIMEHYFRDIRFESVIGAGEYKHKPAPDAVFAILEKVGAAPGECLYIGDTSTDIETAKNAGICGIGVSWGYRDENELIRAGADRIIHCPEELMGIIQV